MIWGSDGALYGTSDGGGGSGIGAVFTLNPDGSGYAILHAFGSGEGLGPSGLVEGSDGVLYGVTDTYSKEPADGTVFALNRDGSGYALLHRFVGAPGDGALPVGGLVEGGDGALYGATQSGGTSNLGTLFRLNKDGSNYNVLYSFAGTGADGKYPVGALFLGTDGAFYGTTAGGGDANLGTVFRWLPPETPDLLDVSLAGGGAQVTFAGTTGQHYRLLRSTDLKTWSVLANITMPAEGVYTYPDAPLPARAAYYRAAWIP